MRRNRRLDLFHEPKHLTEPSNGVWIIGSSGHARSVIDVMEAQGRFAIVGLVVDYGSLGEPVLAYRISGRTDSILPLVDSSSTPRFGVAIGDNWAPAQIVMGVRGLIPVHRQVIRSRGVGEGCM